MIYFAQSASGGPIKIGCTIDLGRRLKELESHYGQPLAVLATLEGGKEEEAEIHSRFSHLRFGRSEQFKPADDLMRFIGRPLLVGADPESVEALQGTRNAVINLKGSPSYAAWLEEASAKTHIAKATIFRVAIMEWAKKNGLPNPPEI